VDVADEHLPVQFRLCRPEIAARQLHDKGVFQPGQVRLPRQDRDRLITQTIRRVPIIVVPVCDDSAPRALAGRRDEAMKQIEEWSRRAAEGYASSFNPAVIYVGLGDRAQALDLLEMAYEERSGWMAYLRVDPRLDLLRDEPRFATLLQHVGLEVEQ